MLEELTLDEDFPLLEDDFFFVSEVFGEELETFSSSSGELGDLSSPQQAKNRDKSRTGMIVFFMV